MEDTRIHNIKDANVPNLSSTLKFYSRPLNQLDKSQLPS